MAPMNFLAITLAAAVCSMPPATAAETPRHPGHKKVTLTSEAAKRLGIQLDEVRLDPSGRRIVPYASVLYDLTGGTFVYVYADPMTFTRESVKIETIKGDNVYLNDGPSPGTKVLATGVAQVFGVEVGVGH